MASTLVIGDIHGCWAELCDLLDAAGPSSDDRILTVGDAIHRGPESGRVLSFFRGPGRTCVLGNHERKHLRAAAGKSRFNDEMARFRHQCGRAYGGVLDHLRTLPSMVSLPDAHVVHAALDPDRPLDHQDERVLTGTPRGEQLLAGRQDRPWWELWRGDRPVLVGHKDFRGDGLPFEHRGRVFGLDTGCVKGGRLTGLLLPEWRFVSVPARSSRSRPVFGFALPGPTGVRAGRKTKPLLRVG